MDEHHQQDRRNQGLPWIADAVNSGRPARPPQAPATHLNPMPAHPPTSLQLSFTFLVFLPSALPAIRRQWCGGQQRPGPNRPGRRHRNRNTCQSGNKLGNEQGNDTLIEPSIVPWQRQIGGQGQRARTRQGRQAVGWRLRNGTLRGSQGCLRRRRRGEFRWQVQGGVRRGWRAGAGTKLAVRGRVGRRPGGRVGLWRQRLR